jgi:hypothetical protein
LSIIVFVECDTEDVDHHGMKECLKYHTEPASTVKTYMEKTVINRAKWIRENSELPIRAVMAEYPRLSIYLAWYVTIQYNTIQYNTIK